MTIDQEQRLGATEELTRVRGILGRVQNLSTGRVDANSGTLVIRVFPENRSDFDSVIMDVIRRPVISYK